jgi:hypothetical protein
MKNPMISRTRILAIAIGLVTGGFLYLRFGWDNNSALSSWEWYQGAALLAGIGLAGIFHEAWLSAAIGLVLAPILVETVQTGLHLSRDPSCCNLWPIGLAAVFFFGLPAPLLGSGIGLLAVRGRLPRVAYFAPLVGALAIGMLLPNIQTAQRQRLETETIPSLLRQIYDAETSYRTSQPGGNFACDGALLPGSAGKLAWTHIGESSLKKYLMVQQFTIRLDCPNEIGSRDFQLRAFSHDVNYHASSFSMDETGRLIVQPVR